MRAEEKGTIPSLLAKLHYGIVELLNESANHLQIISGECNDMSSNFLVRKLFLYILCGFRACII